MDKIERYNVTDAAMRINDALGNRILGIEAARLDLAGLVNYIGRLERTLDKAGISWAAVRDA